MAALCRFIDGPKHSMNEYAIHPPDVPTTACVYWKVVPSLTDADTPLLNPTKLIPVQGR